MISIIDHFVAIQITQDIGGTTVGGLIFTMIHIILTTITIMMIIIGIMVDIHTTRMMITITITGGNQAMVKMVTPKKRGEIGTLTEIPISVAVVS
jgi:hypothetical protein